MDRRGGNGEHLGVVGEEFLHPGRDNPHLCEVDEEGFGGEGVCGGRGKN